MVEQNIKEKYPEAPLYVVDTKCASIGYGLVVRRAAQLAQQGAGIEEILETATYHAQHMEHILTVDDLEYLFRGGRVSRTQALVGTLVNITPILHVEDEQLMPIENVRGSNKDGQRMLQIMEERGGLVTNQTVGISHADDLERAQQI